MKRTMMSLVVACLMVSTAWAQTREIKGAVIDKNGNPLPGAKVEATGGAESTVTDADGTFVIEVSQWLRSLIVTYPGMATRKVNISNTSDVLVRMYSSYNKWKAFGSVGRATFRGEKDADGEYLMRFAGKLGIGYEMRLSNNWFFIPSVEAVWKGSNYEEGDEYEGQAYLCYAQLPLLVGYRFHLSNNSSLLLKYGPYIAYGIYGNIHSEEKGNSWDDDPFENDFRRYDIGISAGVEYGWKSFLIGLNTESGLIKLVHDFDGKNFAVFFTLGYSF